LRYCCLPLHGSLLVKPGSWQLTVQSRI